MADFVFPERRGIIKLIPNLTINSLIAFVNMQSHHL